MLAFAGEDINTNQMVAAIVANLWTSFEAKEPGLETLLMDFDKGRVVATRTSQFVLCVVGTLQAPLGMLKSKGKFLCICMCSDLWQYVSCSCASFPCWC